MKKRKLLACFTMIAMLVTGCGEKPVVLLLELPDIEEITAVKITTIDGFSCTCSDEGWIERFIVAVSGAQATDKATIQDYPASDEYGTWSIMDGDEIIESIYYYMEDGRGYIEKPYQGIYEIDREELKDLIQDMQ